jgi:hypothetical protein
MNVHFASPDMLKQTLTRPYARKIVSGEEMHGLRKRSTKLLNLSSKKRLQSWPVSMVLSLTRASRSINSDLA